MGNPTILATFAVIAAILPMAFVRGLMGPYMRPIPVGASAAMMFSLLVAFIVTPWAALRLLARTCRESAITASRRRNRNGEDWTMRLYRRVMKPLISNRRWRLDVPRARRRALPRRLLARGLQARDGQDAPVRQQERVPGHH